MTRGERIVGAWDGFGADFSERLKVGMAKSIDDAFAELTQTIAADEVIISRMSKIIEEERAKVAEEREACAKIAEAFDTVGDDGYPVMSEGIVEGGRIIAEKIRARGKGKP